MTHNGELLVVEDDKALAALIRDELEAEGWKPVIYHRVQEALAWLEHKQPLLMITDLRLPDGNGMDLLAHIMANYDDNRRPGVIVITAFGSVKQAVQALQAGADDFLTKPLDLDYFLLTVRRVIERHQLQDELQQFRQLSRNRGFHGLFGQSAVMQTLFDQIALIARANGPVLIQGESGTGKELVARAIHKESDRKKGPFLAVNCGGIPAELLESEFFGHAAGAFTGATVRQGLLQQANGGTLLLDEIGEMPVALQVKLLRALQDGAIRPVGEDKEEHVDVRIIAATHRDLKQKVEDGSFREDLYYRLEAFTLTVPALREREDDIELLAQLFLQQLSVNQGKWIKGFSDDTLAYIRQYAFPGNVRELRNVVERALTFCHEDWIKPMHLPVRLVEHNDRAVVTQQRQQQEDSDGLLAGTVLPTMAELQRRYVKKVLKEVDGNKRRAAAILGIGRRTLYRWLD